MRKKKEVHFTHVAKFAPPPPPQKKKKKKRKKERPVGENKAINEKVFFCTLYVMLWMIRTALNVRFMFPYLCSEV